MKRKAFTLIELLVVIAIIALLLSIVLPALQAAKRQAYAAACLSNQKGLTLAWVLYSEDNNDFLVGPMTQGLGHPEYSWVARPEDSNGNVVAAQNSTTQDEIRGIRRGRLFPYVDAPEVYHCPSDRRFLSPPAVSPGASGEGGYRSYSLVSGAGPCTPDEKNFLRHDPHERRSTIRSPCSKYIMVEEMEGRGYNVNSWVIRPQNPNQRTDPIAVWHGRCTLGFADGHSERIKWKDQTTIEMAERQATDFAAPGSEDLAYMISSFPFSRLH